MGNPLLHPERELDRLSDRSVRTFVEDINDLIASHISGSPERMDIAVENLAETLSATMALADLIGRRRAMLELNNFQNRGLMPDRNMVVLDRANTTPLVANVPFREAFENLLSKIPIGVDERLARIFDVRTLGEAVAEAYSRSNVFALAGAADSVVASRVQSLIQSSILNGLPAPTAQQAIANLGEFSQSYSRTVYRTNLTSAYSAGRIQTALDPNIRQIAPALMFVTQRDSDVRAGRQQDHGENHAALDGMIAAPDDPIWREWAPPLGYNCRCSLRFVPILEVERKGLLLNGQMRSASAPAGASKNPRFGRRPDSAFYPRSA